MIYFDMTNWKEITTKQIAKQRDDIQNEKQEKERKIAYEAKKRSNETHKVAAAMHIEEKLTEIRDQVWEVGEVTTLSNTDPIINISLSATWPSYKGSYMWNGGDDRELIRPTVENVVLSINVEIAPEFVKGKSGVMESPIEGNVKISVNPRKYSRKEEDENGMSMVVNANETIDSDKLEILDQILIKAIMEVCSEYPLTLSIQRDRQLIIDMVLSGNSDDKLDRKRVPANFGYNFPPEQPQQTPTHIEPPKKRGFLGF